MAEPTPNLQTDINAAPADPNSVPVVMPAVLPNTEGRPAGLPENFLTVQALAESYKALQGQNTQQAQAAATAPVTPIQNPAIPEAPKVSALQAAMTEYATNGKLSPPTYAAIQLENGLDKTTVDSYIDGKMGK